MLGEHSLALVPASSRPSGLLGASLSRPLSDPLASISVPGAAAALPVHRGPGDSLAQRLPWFCKRGRPAGGTRGPFVCSRQALRQLGTNLLAGRPWRLSQL